MVAIMLLTLTIISDWISTMKIGSYRTKGITRSTFKVRSNQKPIKNPP